MSKFAIISFIFICFLTNANAYIDPVTTGIVTQILFFIFSGILIFFTKLKNFFTLLTKNYKYSYLVLYFIALLPFWIFVENIEFKIKIIGFLFFFIIPFTLIFIVIKFFRFSEKNKIFILINSSITVYGLDQSFGLASIINSLRIIDNLHRYSGYFILFIILIFIFYFFYLKSNKIINFLILTIFFSSIINLINGNKISNFTKYENVENNLLRIEQKSNPIKSIPTIVIIFDELNGYGALDDKIVNTKKTKNSIDTLFKNYNFTHYINAYSIYKSTSDSIPSILNFHYKYDYKKLDLIREEHKNKFGFMVNIKENKLFDLYDHNEIYVRQSLILDMCNKENFKVCKTTNPFSKDNIYMDNFRLSNYDKFFSIYSYRNSIFSTLFTRTLRYFDLIILIEPRMIGKMTIEQTLEDLAFQSKSKKYSLLFAHIIAPHKPFSWEKNTCNYKFYQNENFVSRLKVQENHNIEIQCLNKFLSNFLEDLNQANLLDYYRIILASDHGARNLDINKNKSDWHSTLYAERIPGKFYKKIDEKNSIQFLFKKFFYNDSEIQLENKVYNTKTSGYELH